MPVLYNLVLKKANSSCCGCGYQGGRASVRKMPRIALWRNLPVTIRSRHWRLSFTASRCSFGDSTLECPSNVANELSRRRLLKCPQ